MLEMVFVFAIPAVGAIFLGRKMSAINPNWNWSAIFLAVAFVLSWVVVIMQYQKQSKLLNDLTQKIKEARAEEKLGTTDKK